MEALLVKGTIKLADVAKAAGVSQGTASNVFSRPDVVRDEVREHVLETARQLGYPGPSLTGRLLRAGKVNAIGVAAVEPLAYFFDDPWARALLAAIAQVCDASGTGLALVSAKDRHRLDWNIKNALVDGFILLCVEGGEQLVQLTHERQLPFIALALNGNDPSIRSISVDNVRGLRQRPRIWRNWATGALPSLPPNLSTIVSDLSALARSSGRSIRLRVIALSAIGRRSRPPASSVRMFRSTKPTTTRRASRHVSSICFQCRSRRPPSSRCPITSQC